MLSTLLSDIILFPVTPENFIRNESTEFIYSHHKHIKILAG